MMDNRRDVSTRKITLFHKLAKKLVGLGLHPNHISVASSVFALMAGAALAWSGPANLVSTNLVLLVAAVLGIQLRLVCNLIDGLMAVEGGLKTPTGELYNDIPDRISDIFILVGAGFSAQSSISIALNLSWLASLVAVLTAYIRVLGSSMGAPHFFTGPMAKQHRMFALNCAIIGSAVEMYLGSWGYSLTAFLGLITIGAFLTCLRRLKNISSHINSKT